MNLQTKLKTLDEKLDLLLSEIKEMNEKIKEKK